MAVKKKITQEEYHQGLLKEFMYFLRNPNLLTGKVMFGPCDNIKVKRLSMATNLIIIDS